MKRVISAFAAAGVALATFGSSAADRSGTNHFLARGTGALTWEWKSKISKSPPLRGLVWRAPGRPRAVLVALHGIQTHAAWFGPLGERLSRHGISTYALDRRGSGLNSGEGFVRGHVKGKRELLRDLEGALAKVVSENPGVPLCLLGTSWGANLAAAYAVEAGSDVRMPGIDALVLLVPGITLREPFAPGAAKEFIGKTLGLLMPRKTREMDFCNEHYLAGMDQESAALNASSRPLPAVPADRSEPAPENLGASNQRLREITRRDSQDPEGMMVLAPTLGTLRAGLKLGDSWTRDQLHEDLPILLVTADCDQIMDNQGARKKLGIDGEGQAHSGVSIHRVRAGHGAQITHALEVAGAIAIWLDRL
jgi:alpha-beta hydrolase superfamily lysophospholipase